MLPAMIIHNYLLSLSARILVGAALVTSVGCGSAGNGDNDDPFIDFDSRNPSGFAQNPNPEAFSVSETQSISEAAGVGTDNSTGGASSDTSGSSSSTASSGPSASSVSSQHISDFLWKPASERNGNLVVLVNPSRVEIVVTGSISESLDDSGPSNGRGTTGRSNFSGCSFGDNITVEFFDTSGRRILVADGRSAVRIPRGCDRFEFRL